MNFFAKIDMVFPANWNSAHACSSLCAPDHFVIGPAMSLLVWVSVICLGVAVYFKYRETSNGR